VSCFSTRGVGLDASTYARMHAHTNGRTGRRYNAPAWATIARKELVSLAKLMSARGRVDRAPDKEGRSQVAEILLTDLKKRLWRYIKVLSDDV